MKLYFNINGEWVEPEVDKEVEKTIALNYTFDSLENPTDYISEYAYNIQLPKSARNNKLFDEYKQIDSTIKYKPNERIKYIFISNGDTISNGEAYLVGITESYYEFALNGALYCVFSSLLNSGWDSKNNDEDYFLLDEIWNGLSMSPSTVNYSFNTDTITYDYEIVKHLPFSFQRFVQICGFMQTTGVDMDGFSTDNWLVNFPIFGNKITKVGNDTTGDTTTDTDEITSQMMAEWRCWKLRPYVYVLRLWQIYKEICKTITGYELMLDERWYNEDYEYLKGLVYTLPMIDSENVSESNQHTETIMTQTLSADNHEWTSYAHTIISPNTIQCEGANQATFEWDIPLSFKSFSGTAWQNTNDMHYVFNPFHFVKVTARVTDGVTDYATKSYIYAPQPSYKMNNGVDYQWSISQSELDILHRLADVVNTYRYETKITRGDNYTKLNFGDLTGKMTVTGLATPAHLELDFEVGRINPTSPNTSPIMRLEHRETIFGRETVTLNDLGRNLQGRYEADVIVDSTLTLVNGANSNITMERMMGDVKPFQILLKFSKMVGLLWVVDDYSKTIKVLRRSDYFWDCFHTDMSSKSPSVFPYTGFYDITDLADMTTYSIKPLAWESRNVLLNFDEGDTDYSKKYLEKYGYTYGSKLIRTNYKINNETTELLATNENNSVCPPIFAAEYIKPLSVYINNEHYKVQDDNYMVDSPNVFCYRLKNSTYSTNTRVNDYRVADGVAYVLISTDTPTEVQSNEYVWHFQPFGGDIMTSVRPVFSECNENGYSIMFGLPNELYTTTFPSAKGVGFLYEECWADYIEETYDPDNKTITINARISGQLYNRLKICPFVVLGNIGYLVMSVENWTDANMTKLVMRQVSSVERLYNKSKSKTSVKPNGTDNGDNMSADDVEIDEVAIKGEVVYVNHHS